MDTLHALKQTLPRTKEGDAEEIWLADDPQVTPPTAPVPETTSVLSITEMVLKNHSLLERLIRIVPRQASLIPQLLLIAFSGFVLYGLTMGLVLGASGDTPQLHSPRQVLVDGGALITFASSPSPWEVWRNGTAPALIVAYACGLIAATGICLPSLYFYGLLSGIRLSMRDVVIHSLKAKATASIALVGILPIYFILCLTTIVFRLPEEAVQGVHWLGFVLPFIGGLWGTASLYQGFRGLSDTLPGRLDSVNRYRRTCFLERLVLAWSACYSVISPIMVFTIWQRLQSLVSS